VGDDEQWDNGDLLPAGQRGLPGDDGDPEDDEEFPCELTTTSLDGDSLFSTASEDDLQTFISTIEAHGMDFGLDTPEKVQHFLGQTAHESDGEISIAERAAVFTDYYSEQDLLDRREIGPDGEYSLEEVAGNAELIANIMRSNRLGNGDPSSGDGWAYRGRGPMQHTWKGVYQNFTNFYQSAELGTEDFVESPAKLSDDVRAGTLAAMWFWDKRVLTKSSVDEESLTVEDVTRAINGGTNGLDDRVLHTEAAENNIKCSI